VQAAARRFLRVRSSSARSPSRSPRLSSVELLDDEQILDDAPDLAFSSSVIQWGPTPRLTVTHPLARQRRIGVDVSAHCVGATIGPSDGQRHVALYTTRCSTPPDIAVMDTLHLRARAADSCGASNDSELYGIGQALAGMASGFSSGLGSRLGGERGFSSGVLGSRLAAEEGPSVDRLTTLVGATWESQHRYSEWLQLHARLMAHPHREFRDKLKAAFPGKSTPLFSTCALVMRARQRELDRYLSLALDASHEVGAIPDALAAFLCGSGSEWRQEAAATPVVEM
jgi:hypothetical protein